MTMFTIIFGEHYQRNLFGHQKLAVARTVSSCLSNAVGGGYCKMYPQKSARNSSLLRNYLYIAINCLKTSSSLLMYSPVKSNQTFIKSPRAISRNPPISGS